MGLLIFTLFNSSDVFLLLKLKDAGFGDSLVIGIYIFYNLVYALFSFPMGILGDKFGLKSIFIFGLTLFAIVYFGMTQSADLVYFCILFLMYGIYASSTEGISKAWISNITNKKIRQLRSEHFPDCKVCVPCLPVQLQVSSGIIGAHPQPFYHRICNAWGDLILHLDSKTHIHF